MITFKPNKHEADRWRKLPRKRKIFVENYVRNGFNGRQAARAAGYSPNSPHGQEQEAHRLLRMADVDQYLQHLIAKSKIAQHLTPDVIKTGVYEVLRDASDPNVKLRGWDQLARACGAYSMTLRVEDATTEELLRQAKESGMVADDEIVELAQAHGVDARKIGLLTD